MNPRRRLVKRANPEDQSKTVHNCPFCGSGGVTGGSDGSITCGFCEHTFKVYIQPTFVTAPSNVNGQPVEQGQRSDEPAPLDEGSVAGPGIETFRTASGKVLGRGDYLRHLAISHARDRQLVLKQVRSDVRR